MTENRWNTWWNIFVCPVPPLNGIKRCHFITDLLCIFFRGIPSALSLLSWLFIESLLVPGRRQYSVNWKEKNWKFMLTREVLSWWSHNFHICRSGKTKHNINLWTLILFIKNLARSMFYSLFSQPLHICTLFFLQKLSKGLTWKSIAGKHWIYFSFI